MSNGNWQRKTLRLGIRTTSLQGFFAFLLCKSRSVLVWSGEVGDDQSLAESSNGGERRNVEVSVKMGAASKAGDWAFKAFTAGLGVATIYLTATFSVNVYRGLSWHKAQSKINHDNTNEEAT
ncbi:unnamed protein product [Citrullus colocynthis]|uniref:Transmembrane protein n=1 Tax=Citrullus colocynthis TaxID=252529 RepID=A0ABP0XZI2_9ROSI